MRGCAYLASHPGRRESRANAGGHQGAGTSSFVVFSAEKESGESVFVVIFKCGHPLIKCRRLEWSNARAANSREDSRICSAKNFGHRSLGNRRMFTPSMLNLCGVSRTRSRTFTRKLVSPLRSPLDSYSAASMSTAPSLVTFSL